MAQQPILICIVGPTAIGKTSLSIKVADAFSAEIISADSRQFYKEMRIGTAVPSSEELNAVPHHFIQNRSVFGNYSVGDFEKDALQTLDHLFQKQPIAVMVGGSGLYIDAVVKGLDVFPKVASHLREELNELFKTQGIAVLQQELKEVDPEYYNQVDVWNHHRLIRALEIFRSTGKPYSSFLTQTNTRRNFDILFIGLQAERQLVYERINERVDAMMEEGLLEEAKALWDHRDLNALQTVGYKELFEYFEGSISLDEAVSEIKKNTRRFSKRQSTWFKKNDKINWFAFDTPAEEIITFIKRQMESNKKAP